MLHFRLESALLSIDHRTLAEQGIERIPQIHIGTKVPEMERRGIRTDIGGQALTIETHNACCLQVGLQGRDGLDPFVTSLK